MAKVPAKEGGALQNWAHVFDLILRRDNRPREGVERVIAFATASSFWRSNIVSPGSLRKEDAAKGGKHAAARTWAPAREIVIKTVADSDPWRNRPSPSPSAAAVSAAAR
jgi:hypothetical protein